MSETLRPHTLRVAATPEFAARAAASEIVALLDAALSWRGEAHLCLAGGTTPRLLHEALTELPFEGWPHVHIWFGDERCVPPDHRDSNVGMARQTLLDRVAVSPEHVHRLAGELPPEEAARQYHDELHAMAARRGRTIPVMDVLVLGLGGDGHTASLFPGSPLLTPESAPATWSAAVHVPALGTSRLTLTPVVLQAAAAVIMLVTGPDKQQALARVLRRAAPVAQLPARLLESANGDVAWFVDEQAVFGR